MHFIQEILGLKRLYGRKFGVAYLVDGIYIIFGGLFLSVFISQIFPENQVLPSAFMATVIALLFLFYIYSLSRFFAIRSIIKNRKYTINTHAQQSLFFASSTNDLMNIKDQTDFFDVRDTYSMYDVRFDFYRKTRRGEFKSREEFHTVIEYKLRRELPHLIFDAKSAKGRQFKAMFLKSQKLSLEGNFDEYFDTYSPMFYQIDTLSFITPEVMQEFIKLGEYDFEIKGDRLIILAPLLKNKEVDEFKKRTHILYAELNQNLRAYRDSRIDSGKHKISEFGRSLLISPKRKIISLIINSVVVGLGLFIAWTFSDTISADLLIYLGFAVLALFWQANDINKIIRNNRNKIQAYKKIHS